MKVYLVTSKSEHRDSNGVVTLGTCNLHGIFTNSLRADAIAYKYNGSVTEHYVDIEETKTILQSLEVEWSR